MSVHRLFNLVCAIAGIIILAPLFLLVAMAILIQDGRPVLYKGRRVGRGGVPLGLYKFRSMAVNADRHGPGLTRRDDPRIIPIGRFLRRTKIDEVPQLLNVISGQLNLVGARPEDPRYVALYNNEQREILGYTPGMKSPASLFFRNEDEFLGEGDNDDVYVSTLMPRKIEMDLAYLRHQTVPGDIVIIVKTLLALVRG
jgi:lipopolysaccharide/colanic/teichoic acid biosynthesis glycosyltransferase